MALFAVTYTYTDDDAGRDEHRPAHREYLGGLAERGINLGSGPFGADDVPGALILLRADSRDEAVRLTENDPMRIHGLIAEVDVREWTPVLGRLAQEI